MMLGVAPQEAIQSHRVEGDHHCLRARRGSTATDPGPHRRHLAVWNHDGGLAAGQQLTRCINVSYTGSWTGRDLAIKLYGSASGALAPYLNLVVEKGAGASYGSCGGFAAEGRPI